MPTSCWLIGSYANIPATTITIAGSGQAFATGSFYLYHSSGSLSLLSRMVTLMTNAGVTSPAAVLMQNRKVKLSGGSAFAVTWGTDTTVRDILGYTGNLSSATSHEAPLISKYLWSPGRTESPKIAPLGVSGAKVYDTKISTSGTGFQKATQHNSYRINSFFWRYIAQARYWTSSELGGEYFPFFDAVLRKLWKFNVWRTVTEDDASTSTVSLTSLLGPYELRASEIPRWDIVREQGLELLDSRFRCDLDVIEVAQYT